MDQAMDIKPRKNFNILKWVLIIGIVVVLNLFFNFAISSFYHAPKYEDFCKNEQINVQPVTKEACVAIGGQWNESSSVEKVLSPIPSTPQKLQTNSYCNPTFTCQKNYEQVKKVYERNVFVILVILGILSLIGGFFLIVSSVVSLGLSLGGVLSLVVASIRYWSEMNEYIRVIILGLALIVLIWIGIKKFREN
jgi:hypothetical protein